MHPPFWLNDAQMERIAKLLPHGCVRRDDRPVLSGVIHLLTYAPSWEEIPSEYGPRATLFSRLRRWGGSGVLDRIFAEARKGQAAVLLSPPPK